MNDKVAGEGRGNGGGGLAGARPSNNGADKVNDKVDDKVYPTYFLPYQRAWIADKSPLKIIEKSRQVGISHADAYDSVVKAAMRDATLDVWVTSRDKIHARLYLEDCRKWAKILNHAAHYYGEMVFDEGKKKFTAFVLEFANGRRIYALSSNVDVIAGKHGHIKIDEYALHPEQRGLYAISMPGIMWGGQLCIISTHRGIESRFNRFIRDILDRANPMGWSHHRVSIQNAVAMGVVGKINEKTGRSETPEEFLKRMRQMCVDEEQWTQEFCCIPADENSAFLSYELIERNFGPDCLKNYGYLTMCENPLYVGMDVARNDHLCVIDVGELIGDVMWDRLRIEMRHTEYGEMERQLYRILDLPQVKRCCIDKTGNGEQLAERAMKRFGPKVEGIRFNATIKEELAYGVRQAMEDRRLRLDTDPNLVADLRGIKRDVTSAGNIRFLGESKDSHCDRFWAKALRQHAVKTRKFLGATVI